MTEATKVFKYIYVGTSAAGVPTVQWDLADSFTTSDTVGFYVERSLDLDTWTRLNESSPVSTYVYADSDHERLRIGAGAYYRVILDDDGTEHTSQAMSMLSELSATMRLKAYAVMREFYIHLSRSGAGVPGMLLRKRRWGTPCTACTDFSTGAVLDADCTTCYGTGIVGGYFPAYALYGKFIKGAQFIRANGADTGPMQSASKEIVFPAFPVLEEEDIWVHTALNERYRINKLAHVSEVEGVPLIYGAEVALLEPGVIEYQISVA